MSTDTAPVARDVRPRQAEAAGFTGIALADHVAIPVGFRSVHPSGERPFEADSEFPDPLVTAAAMLAVTTPPAR